MKTWLVGGLGMLFGGAIGAMTVYAWGSSGAVGPGVWQLLGAASGAFVSVMTALGVVKYEERREADRVRSYVIATIDDVIDAANELGGALLLHGKAEEGVTSLPPEFWSNLTRKAETLVEMQDTAHKRLPRIEANVYKLDFPTLRIVFEIEDLLPEIDPTIREVIARGKDTATRMYGNTVPEGWSYPLGFYAGRLGKLRRQLEG